MSDNNVTIVGNATRDPELRFTPTGMAIANFGVAVNRRWQKDGEWQEKVSFIDVVCWQKLAENVAETISKGSRVIVIGRFDMNTWDDKETGKPRSKIELVADSVGPDLRWATAVVERNPKAEGGYSNREPDFASSGSSGSGRPGGGRPAGDPGPSYENEEPF